ncbi:MAG: fimbrial protein [Hafnia sp.]|uniref:fimbrial protein n=1 Tax=Hafnia sp. TaxID=1873498 RepID=UPI002FC5A77B
MGYRAIFNSSLLLSIILLLFSKCLWAVVSPACIQTSYTPTSWHFKGGDFTAWLATNPAATDYFVVADRSITSSDMSDIPLVCDVTYANGTGGTTHVIRAINTYIRPQMSFYPGNSSYYQMDGFSGIGFQIVLNWNNSAIFMYKSSGGGMKKNNKISIYPSEANKALLNFPACTTEGTGYGASMCTWGGAYGGMSAGNYIPQYLNKNWVYELRAYKLSPSVTLGTFTSDKLPKVNVDANFQYWGVGSWASSSPKMYCLGCSAAEGVPPTVTVPANCTIITENPKLVTLQPFPIRWTDFTQSQSAGTLIKANEQWTPFTLELSCDKSVKATLYASDATISRAPAADAWGKLINSADAGSNVGVQIYYKTEADKTCTNSSSGVINGLPLELNRTNTKRISVAGANSSIRPFQSFCARYYTTATSNDNLSIGTVTATMAYTFEYE